MLCTHCQSNEIDFEFVNQVRGETFDGSMHPRTRNETDGGVQCNPDGPDKFPTAIKVPFMGGEPKLTALFMKHQLSPGITGQPNLYKKREKKRSTRKRAKRHHQILASVAVEEGEPEDEEQELVEEHEDEEQESQLAKKCGEYYPNE